MKSIIYIILLFTATTGFAQQSLDELLDLYNTRSVAYVSVEEARMLQLNGDVTILDTREKDEYDVSHLQNAQWVGFNQFSAEEIAAKIENKNTPILVYCSLGIRSEEIGEKLMKVGFTNVRNVYGGIFEWKNNKFPVMNHLERETDSVHVFSKAWSKWLTRGIKITSQDE